VSAFAAGCALCGADLDPHRAQRPATIGERFRRCLAARAMPRGGRSVTRR
jgi:hypothetical protein